MNLNLLAVLGMHRSGTSALTRGLQTIGVSLGEHLMSANAMFNAKGFWEDMDIYSLNVEMLQSLGADWYQASLPDANQINQLFNSDYGSQAIELLRNKTRESPIFGFKDPRMGKLLPFWKRIFQQGHYRVGYLLALRNPLSVAGSLEKRDELDRTHSYLLWLTHTLNCVKESEENPRIIVDFDKLMQAPQEQITRIAKVFNLQVDSGKLAEYAEDFLNRSLRHFTYSVDDLKLDQSCPGLVAQCYGELLDAAEEKQEINDPVFLFETKKWWEELNRISPIIACVDRFDSELRRLKSSAKLCQSFAIQNPRVMGDFLEAQSYFAEWMDGVALEYSESRAVTQVYALDGQPKTIKLIFPADLQPLVRLRLDIAHAPAEIYLHDLTLHDVGGTEIWRWNCGYTLFADPKEMVCLPSEQGLTIFSLSDDPRADLAIPDEVLAQIKGEYFMRMELTARPLLEALPNVLEQLQARAHDNAKLPALSQAYLPVGFSGHMEELAGLLRTFIERKNAIVSAQQQEMEALLARQQMLQEQLIRAEAQLDLLKEFALGGAGTRLERL